MNVSIYLQDILQAAKGEDRKVNGLKVIIEGALYMPDQLQILQGNHFLGDAHGRSKSKQPFITIDESGRILHQQEQIQIRPLVSWILCSNLRSDNDRGTNIWGLRRPLNDLFYG